MVRGDTRTSVSVNHQKEGQSMSAELKNICFQEKVLSTDESVTEAFFSEHQQLSLELGFLRQFKSVEENLRKLRRPIISTPPLSLSELLVWKSFLPTSYRGARLAGYDFDLIPIHVLSRIREWKEIGAFDEFEIRTEEITNDPAVFGIRDRCYWLLARWGPSDEVLLSFDEIRAKLRAAELRYHKKLLTVFFVSLSVLFATRKT